MNRLLPPNLVVLILLVMVALTLVLPIAVWPPSSWRLVGLGPVVGGIGLTVGGSRIFSRVRTNIKTFDDPDVLVADGPFRRSRNPMYLGFVLFLVGVAILLGAASAWVGPIAFFVAADRWYIPFEEVRMSETFGPAYATYTSTVRRWL